MTAPSLSPAVSVATDTARKYYDSSDADTFYRTIWGGSDIHIGLYDSPSDSIATASHRTVIHMASLLEPITPSTRILDMGAGYGGAARYLAKTYGCKVTCLNLSKVENERNRELTKEAGLEGLVEVVEGSFEHVEGSFEHVPCQSRVFDVVWSQDAFLHFDEKSDLISEISRVLVDDQGGRVIFTDPMAVEGTDPEALAPILQRLDLESLGSLRLYWMYFDWHFFEAPKFEDHTEQMVTHYTRVLEELEARQEQLKGKISDEYVKNMKVGLGHWIDGGKKGQLQWGVVQLRRKLPGYN